MKLLKDASDRDTMHKFEQFLSDLPKIRLDIWLWSARFFKTRSLCKQAIVGGKIEVNKQTAKASRQIAIGDEIVISRGQEKMTVVVKLLADRRGPASLAVTLYEETPTSQAEREKQAEIRRINQAAMVPSAVKPNKKQRRQIHRFKSRSS